ncbi:hypothetical protein IGI52_000573 [Enterococcus sp. DIV0187]
MKKIGLFSLSVGVLAIMAGGIVKKDLEIPICRTLKKVLAIIACSGRK